MYGLFKKKKKVTVACPDAFEWDAKWAKWALGEGEDPGAAPEPPELPPSIKLRRVAAAFDDSDDNGPMAEDAEGS